MSSMKLIVRRIDRHGRYETLIERDDGVEISARGVAHTFSIPHDLAHFVVEHALSVDAGFWGSIAQGAVFPMMNYRRGRRKPNADERSRTVQKVNAGQLGEAEVLVRIFNDTIEQGHAEVSPVLHARLNNRWAPPGTPLRNITQEQIVSLFAAYRGALARWKETPVGGTVELCWAMPHHHGTRRGSRGSRSTRRRN